MIHYEPGMGFSWSKMLSITKWKAVWPHAAVSKYKWIDDLGMASPAKGTAEA